MTYTYTSNMAVEMCDNEDVWTVVTFVIEPNRIVLISVPSLFFKMLTSTFLCFPLPGTPVIGSSPVIYTWPSSIKSFGHRCIHNSWRSFLWRIRKFMFPATTTDASIVTATTAIISCWLHRWPSNFFPRWPSPVPLSCTHARIRIPVAVCVVKRR